MEKAHLPKGRVQVLGEDIVDVIRELNMVVRNLMPNPISGGKVGGR